MIFLRRRTIHLLPTPRLGRPFLGLLFGLSCLVFVQLACNKTSTDIQYQDMGAPADSGVPFLGPCSSDEQCSSGHCISIGDHQSCSRTCSATMSATDDVCPALEGWSCDESNVCQCAPSRRQVDRCGVDGDCDGKPDKIPEAEICNSEDDDCNGTVDDIKGEVTNAVLYYQDQDADGFGDVFISRWSCQPEDGWSTKGGDCDDTVKATHPEAEEICVDGLDNDCDSVKDNPEICGRVPIVVEDVSGTERPGTLKTCETSTNIDAYLDITEIVAKQDATYIKFAIFLADDPGGLPCASFSLHLGINPASYNMVYLFRPVLGPACESLPAVEAFENGLPIFTELVASFLPAPTGQITFTLPKMEYYPQLTKPTYHLKACSNRSATADPLGCEVDTCLTPVRRE